MRSTSYSQRPVLFWNPIILDSPSGEVQITVSRWLCRLPGIAFRWTMKVRGMYASGRGSASLADAMNDFAGRLSPIGSPAAVELGRIMEWFAE